MLLLGLVMMVLYLQLKLRRWLLLWLHLYYLWLLPLLQKLLLILQQLTDQLHLDRIGVGPSAGLALFLTLIHSLGLGPPPPPSSSAFCFFRRASFSSSSSSSLAALLPSASISTTSRSYSTISFL